MKVLAAVLTVGLVCGTSTANATPMIQNGDFENVFTSSRSYNPADIPGWTHTGDAGDGLLWNAPAYFGAYGSLAGHGNQFVTMGGGPGYGSAGWSTVISGLTAGDIYTVTFMASAEVTTQPLGVSVGGGPVTNFLTTPGPRYWDNWQSYAVDFVAAGATESLAFSTSTVEDVGLDYVQIHQKDSPVPEPGSLALLGVGLAGLGFCTRRRLA